MRITDRLLVDKVLGNIQRNESRLSSIQDQVSTGRRISVPSDDPTGSVRSLTLRSNDDETQQSQQNLDLADAWLNATDTALQDVNSIVQRARELAVQGANDTLDTSQRTGIAAEVDQLLQQMVTLGNATLKGQRLFAGLKTDANPFILNAGPPTTVTYSGDNGQMLREIDVGLTMAINTPGNTAFAPAFAALVGLRDHLNAGDAASVRGTDFAAIDSALDTVLASRASVGAKVNRLESAQTRQQELQARITELLAKTEDTDYTAAVSEFSLQDTVYKAGMQAASKALQPSLLDYLR
jgi:flagellar hook-associated protein 3 FlgL